jgi:hypothetical protein
MNTQKKAFVEMVERTGPEIFRFEKAGDYLRCRLIEIETADISGKPTLRYIVSNEDDGKLCTFLGTVDLNTKIRASDMGKVLEIRYGGLESQSGPGKNPIKRFKVFVEKDK